jgi:branched-chain amino acid transport system ATP-binding protein
MTFLRRRGRDSAIREPGPVLAVDDLTCSYTQAPVLRDITIEVRVGEIVALFGANGAGKTTLLRAITGTVPRAHGNVLLDGRRIDRMSPWDRIRSGLAHVPEGRHVFAPMTVRDNLVAAAVGTRQKPSFDEVYDLFPRLQEREAQLAGTLSGGEQQMLSIGRALMTRPRVLLIDEMSAGLAPVVTQRLVDALVEIRNRGVTILLVEQAPHMVADTIDRAYLLSQGRIAAQGTLAELGGSRALADNYLGVR